MTDWMKNLALHYEEMKGSYPEDRLLILFDIDGTILDMRFLILYSFRQYDRINQSNYFSSLTIPDIRVTENQVDQILFNLGMTSTQKNHFLDWYHKNRWAPESIRESHRPYAGVMEVIRWFQIQAKTYVGINTGRSETLREATLQALNELGKEYKVHFTNEMLYMNPTVDEADVPYWKVHGIFHFQNMGYRIFAFVDNEPRNLKAVSEYNLEKEILLLHADTIFESKRNKLPSSTVSGKIYDITELIPERSLPEHIQFVWHGIGHRRNLSEFLSSDIQWGEMDVRLDTFQNRPVVSNLSTEKITEGQTGSFFDLEWYLDELGKYKNKSLKLDLTEGGILLDRVTHILGQKSWPDERLWFSGPFDQIGERGFKKLSKAFPKSIIQIPVDYFFPIIFSMPKKIKFQLDLIRTWGINRISVSWDTPFLTTLMDQFHEWGWDVNVYNVPDLEHFLKAVLLNPKSITADFNFPKWNYFGMGIRRDYGPTQAKSIPIS